MPNLTKFLLARIAEDETSAREAADDEHLLRSLRSIASTAPLPGAEVTHIVRWDPARVLAECAAKRRIIAKHQRVKFTDVSLGIVDADVCQKCHHVEDSPDEEHDEEWTYPLVQDDFPCKTLRYLVSIYADHPDFDASWRVE